MKKWSCTRCGWESSKWYGRCPECGNWELEEKEEAPRGAGASLRSPSPVFPSTSLRAQKEKRIPTGFGELDRVLGGGIVPGSAILLAGEPGIGKSTILLQASAKIAREGRKVLYVSAEESCPQVAARMERVGAFCEDLFVTSTRDTEEAVAAAEKLSPDLAVFDSIQALASPGAGGSASQIREASAKIIEFSKRSGTASLIVGHVTKDGSIAGPRTMEHLVDVVCQFEGESHTALRIVRAVKNRFGSTDEIGCFEMKGGGVEEVTDPYGIFLARGESAAPGKCVALPMEGKRCLPLEIEALCAPRLRGESSQRAVNGLDYSRVAMIAAALQQHAKIYLSGRDLYLSTIAGAKTREPASDLAIALALASSFKNSPLPGVAAIGEVSLTGRIRPVGMAEQRLETAERMGFKSAVVPAAQKDIKEKGGISLFRVDNLNDILQLLR
ncbi:MAG: DNA repair protein RadA [Aeriscardovia sp.]|nr:DNA repair protein RadA [Aeriscardovia sp.]